MMNHGFLYYLRHPKQFFIDSNTKPQIRELKHDEETYRQLISQISLRQLERDEKAFLESASPTIVPHLHELLQQPHFLKTRYPDSVQRDSPLETVLRLLRNHRAIPAVLLDSIFKDHEAELTETVYYLVAETGNDDAIPYLIDGLRSPNFKNAEQILSGLGYSSHEKSWSRVFRTALFCPVMEFMNSEHSFRFTATPKALIRLDRDEATLKLMEQRFFRHDHPLIHKTLQAFNELNVKAPVERVLDMMNVWKNQTLEYPLDDAFGEGMIQLAKHEGLDITEYAEIGLEAENKSLGYLIGNAFLELAGVKNPIDVISQRMNVVGIDGLPAPMRDVYVLWEFECEISNGGIAQYLFNFGGNHSKYVIPALPSVGLEHLIPLVETIWRLFGPQGPSEHRELRMEQLSQIDFSHLNEWDTAFYKFNSNWHAFMMIHVFENHEIFKVPI